MICNRCKLPKRKTGNTILENLIIKKYVISIIEHLDTPILRFAYPTIPADACCYFYLLIIITTDMKNHNYRIPTNLSNRSATGSAYFASEAVNSTHSYNSPHRRRNSSTCGRFSTYTWCTAPSISTGTTKSALLIGCNGRMEC